MELPASYEIRFARGTARTSLWCAVEHRVIDWAFHSLFHGESEVVIMIAVVESKRCMGRIETSDLKLITSEPMVGKAKHSTRAKWRSSLSACRGVEKKGLTEPVLLETAMLRQADCVYDSQFWGTLLQVLGASIARPSNACQIDRIDPKLGRG